MLVTKGKTGILKGVDFGGIGGDSFDFGGQSLMSPPKKKKKKKEPPKTKKTKSTEPTSGKYRDALDYQRRREPKGGTPNPHTR